MSYAREKGACSGNQTKRNIIRAPRISSNPFSDFQYRDTGTFNSTRSFFSPQPSIKILVVWCLFSLFNTESSLWPQPHPKTSLGNYFEGKRILMSQFKHIRSCIICPAEPHILLQVSLAAGMPAGDCTALLFPLQRRD